jgi:hypothetical protein
MYIRMYVYVYVYVYVYIGALNAVSIRHVPKEAGGSWGLAGVVSMCVCMCVCNLSLPPPKGCMYVWNLLSISVFVPV